MTTSDDWSIDEFLDGYEPRTEAVRICMRPDLLARHEQLERQLVAARGDDDLTGGPHELAEQVRQVEADIERAMRTFRFREVDARAWADLVAKHPPTLEQRAMGDPFNPETFSVAAVALCAWKPAMTLEQAKKLERTVSHGSFRELWNAVLGANSSVAAAPKSVVADAVHRLSAGSATTSAPEASPDPGSLAGPAAASPPTTTTPPDV